MTLLCILHYLMRFGMHFSAYSALSYAVSCDFALYSALSDAFSCDFARYSALSYAVSVLRDVVSNVCALHPALSCL